MITRRSLLGSLAAMPALAFFSRPARALTEQPLTDAEMGKVTGGVWDILGHAVDGTDPSTMVTTELPRITPDIRALAGKDIELTGYVQPVVSSTFGQNEYILSQMPFHCTGCYPAGRAGLALVQTVQNLHHGNQAFKVTIKGTLALNETVPDDFYFILKDAVART